MEELAECVNSLIVYLGDCDNPEIIDYIVDEIVNNGYVELERLKELSNE